MSEENTIDSLKENELPVPPAISISEFHKKEIQTLSHLLKEKMTYYNQYLAYLVTYIYTDEVYSSISTVQNIIDELIEVLEPYISLIEERLHRWSDTQSKGELDDIIALLNTLKQWEEDAVKLCGDIEKEIIISLGVVGCSAIDFAKNTLVKDMDYFILFTKDVEKGKRYQKDEFEQLLEDINLYLADTPVETLFDKGNLFVEWVGLKGKERDIKLAYISID